MRAGRCRGHAALPPCNPVDALLDDEIVTSHPIRMEVLVGARDEQHLNELRGLLARASLLPTAPADYEEPLLCIALAVDEARPCGS